VEETSYVMEIEKVLVKRRLQKREGCTHQNEL
jgi:hypothetical protein